MIVCINGKFVNEKKAFVSIYDRAFLYGDGIFETLTVFNGKVLWFQDHFNRMKESAKLTFIKLPFSKTQLLNLLNKVIAKNNLKNFRIRINISRGDCPKPMSSYTVKGYLPNYFIIPYEFKLPLEKEFAKGIRVVSIQIERFMPRAKTLNFMPSVLAYLLGKKKDKKMQDVIMISRNGFVTETGNSNVFIVKNGKIFTPKNNVLLGVARKNILKFARTSGYKVIEKDFKLSQLLNADEVFLSASGKGLIPVIKINNKNISRGKPGKITLSILEKFKEKYYFSA